MGLYAVSLITVALVTVVFELTLSAAHPTSKEWLRLKQLMNQSGDEPEGTHPPLPPLVFGGLYPGDEGDLGEGEDYVNSVEKKDEYGYQYYLPDDIHESITRKLRGVQGVMELQKRKGPQETLVFFECLAGQAVCHNGSGPAITYRPESRPICTCICPQDRDGPQCIPTESDSSALVLDEGNPEQEMAKQ